MKRVVFLSVILGLVLGGCNKPDPNDDIQQVVIFINAKSLSNSVLKSTASEAEKAIPKLIIYSIDVQNNVEKLQVFQNPSLDDGIALVVSREIKAFYAIANPSAEIEAANPTTVTALKDLIVSFSSAPQSPFIMSGEANIGSSKYVNIELVRAVAKIEITGLNDFVIQSVTVRNTPDRGFVFERELPPSAVRVNYPAINVATPALYVAENSSIYNPTVFRVTGTFDGKQASYDVVLKIGNNNIAIVRNTHYQVSISPITEDDYEITITIPDWNFVKTDDHIIPDENFQN